MWRRGHSYTHVLRVAGLLLVFGATMDGVSANWRHRRIYFVPAPCLPYTPSPPPCVPPDNPSTEKVRRNINSLSSRQVESLRRGVAAMKNLPDTDLRSWTFQAGIHGSFNPMPHPLFNQCQHNSNEFLVWHRGYLYYFERILRELSGDPELTLPYWDWAANKSLPEPFRLPADATNPLFDATRFSHINNGLPVPTDVPADQAIAMAQVPFWFGFSSSLEGSPHGAVHIDVGGNMTGFKTAGLDPIFWLHHCNVDHVWDRWLNQGGGRVNPSDAAFFDKTYSFADENGAVVSHKIRDILTSRQLGYHYDDVPNLRSPAPAPMVLAAQVVIPKVHQRVAMAAAPGKPPAQESKPLGLQSVTEKLSVVPQQTAALRKAVARVQTAPLNKILLKIEDLSAAEAPEFSYGVYLNLPPGKLTREQARFYYLGSFNFFGKAPSGKDGHDHAAGKTFDQTFDATAVVARLAKASQWNQENLRVTIMPMTPEATADPALQKRLEASSEKAKVTYRGVSLFAAP